MRPYQIPVLTSGAIDDVTVSAPQLGKTLTAGLWLLARAYKHGSDLRPWWWTAPTYYQARHGYLGIVAAARSAGILDTYTTTTPLELKLTVGAVIQARSWERPENMYGPSVLGGVSDEFGEMTALAYSAISSRRAETITRGFGYWRWIGNVGDVGGEAEKLWHMAESGAAGFAARRWTWRDRALAHECPCGDLPIEAATANEHSPRCHRGIYLRFIAREMSRMSGPQFRRLYNAEWADWNELPVYEFDREIHVDDRKATISPFLPLEVSCDFNVDPLVWAIGQHKGDEIWDADEIAIEGSATTRDACRELIRRYPNKRQPVIVYGDASGKARSTKSNRSDYEIMAEMLGAYYEQPVRFEIASANPPVTERVNAVNAMLQSADGTVRYWVNSRCRRIVDDRARVSWKPGTRDIDKSNKARTHASDASDYRIVRLFPVQAPLGRVYAPSFDDEFVESNMQNVTF